MNTYAYVGGNPLRYVDPLGLDAIYINYDYYPVTTPVGKLPLGHGAVVAVNPETGYTKYYEFGRYGDANGVVRSAPIPNVVIGKDGLPTPSSLSQLYAYLSHNFGHDVNVSATYYPNSDYQGTINYAEKFKLQHPAYDLFGNNRGGNVFSDSAISGSLAQPRPWMIRQTEEQAHEKDEKESRTGI